MRIEIYKCDYCHKDIDEPDDYQEMNNLFGYDACRKCYFDFWFTLEKKLSTALFDFVNPKKNQASSSVLSIFCDKCKADYSTAKHIEKVSGRDVTAFGIPNLRLSLSFDLCDKCSDEVYPIFKKIAAEMLDKYRVKYKKKDIAKLTYINELFEYSSEEKK